MDYSSRRGAITAATASRTSSGHYSAPLIPLSEFGGLDTLIAASQGRDDVYGNRSLVEKSIAISDYFKAACGLPCHRTRTVETNRRSEKQYVATEI